MTAELLTRDERNRLRAYEYDHDDKESTDDISCRAGSQALLVDHRQVSRQDRLRHLGLPVGDRFGQR